MSRTVARVTRSETGLPAKSFRKIANVVKHLKNLPNVPDTKRRKNKKCQNCQTEFSPNKRFQKNANMATLKLLYHLSTKNKIEEFS